MSNLKQSYIDIDTPMAPPAWALMEWELIRTQERACAEFFEHNAKVTVCFGKVGLEGERLLIAGYRIFQFAKVLQCIA